MKRERTLLHLLHGLFFWGFLLSEAVMAMPGKIPTPKPNFNTSVRVILEKAQKAIQVRTAKGNVYYSFDDRPPWIPLGNEANLRVIKRNGRASIAINGRDTRALVLFFRAGSSSGPLSWRSAFYRGGFRVHFEKELLSLTNIVPLELYVTGVIGSEMGEHWPQEALKAQAVAARSYAIQRVLAPRNSWYDLESTVQDQVYRGIQNPQKNLELAVKDTEGLVLKENGRVIQALFHSRCGGQTDAAKAVWNNEKRATADSVLCPGCRERRYAWSMAVPVVDILRKLNLPSSPLAFAVSRVERATSGRIQNITISADDEHRTLGSNEFRSLFGFQKIKSALFKWKIANDALMIEGEGAGHGVGLCQWGAKYLADQGKDYRAILHHYYPGKVLEPHTGTTESTRALSWYAPIRRQPTLTLSRSSVLPNHTSFRWVFDSATTRRARVF